LRATADTDLVPITVQLRNRDLSFQSKQGVQSAVLDLYGRITDPVAGSFRHLKMSSPGISRVPLPVVTGSLLDLSEIRAASIRTLPFGYRDQGHAERKHRRSGTALRVPHFDQEKLDASSLILADQIERVASRQIGTGQFVLDSYKVRPRLSQEFSGADKLGIYLQLYNLKLDESSRKTKVSVAYRIAKDQEEVWRTVETEDHLHKAASN